MTIAGIGGRIKRFLSKIPKDALLVAAIFLVATGSFGLGILAGKDMEAAKGSLWIEERPLTDELPASVIAAEGGIPTPAPSMPAGGQYVASKNGSAYYLPYCGGARNIKEENKVWFASKEEAEAKGYRPAKNCKGI